MPTSISTAPGLTMSTRDEPRLADGGDDQPGLAQNAGQADGARVAKGDGGIAVGQHGCHRLADQEAPPHDGGVHPGRVDAVMIEDAS